MAADLPDRGETILDTIRARRSVRDFLAEPVPRDVLRQIAAAGQEAPSGCNMQAKQFVVIDDPAVMDRIRPFSGALSNAPAAVVLLIEPKGTAFGEFWVQDASAAMENMLLAAVGLGYGAVWVEGALRPQEEKLRKVLGVSNDLRVWAIMPVGKADVEPTRPAKSAFGEVTHYNRFGERGQ